LISIKDSQDFADTKHADQTKESDMNTWWGKLSLKGKLQLPIQLILLVIMVLAQRAVLNTFEERVLEAARG